jgi:hypothetical protein
MTESSSAPFQAHNWLSDHALAMHALEAGLVAKEDLVTVRIPITTVQAGHKSGVLMTPFYRLPDGWSPAAG